jgi:hypothetical protein
MHLSIAQEVHHDLPHRRQLGRIDLTHATDETVASSPP